MSFMSLGMGLRKCWTTNGEMAPAICEVNTVMWFNFSSFKVPIASLISSTVTLSPATAMTEGRRRLGRRILGRKEAVGLDTASDSARVL
eukprot:2612904-Alexandrium_andersonii.AAC.1